MEDDTTLSARPPRVRTRKVQAVATVSGSSPATPSTRVRRARTRRALATLPPDTGLVSPEEADKSVLSAKPANAPRPARLRRARVSEPVSAPAGFGGAGAPRRFSDALTDAMMATSSMDAIPTWWPANRLPAFRGPLAAILDRACRQYLHAPAHDMMTCSSTNSSKGVVEQVVSFVQSGPCTPIQWEDAHSSAVLAQWAGVDVLVIHADPDQVHVVAPGSMPSSHCKPCNIIDGRG